MFATDPTLALPMLDFMATRISELVELVAVPDVLSCALRTLIEAGLIQVQRHQIRILDRQGLLEHTIAEQR